MTSYHGGKQRIGKRLAQIIVDESMVIEKQTGFKIKGYCEPFCGMLGVYRHIPRLLEENKYFKLEYKAGDTNASVIKMWNAVKRGWKPPTTCSAQEFAKLKGFNNSTALKGYIGHQYSFGGQWFNCYAPKYGKTSDSTQASTRVIAIGKEMKNTTFTKGDYTQFSNLKGYIIYCDPPYVGHSCRYKATFDNIEFWDWCKSMAKNNIIFVSGYSAPRQASVIFKDKHKLTGRVQGARDRTEKLYIL
jgi:site-specific DNA-adenine methylase